ncbi:MAG: RluA family pseudouridine synthase [Candidatus Omnitrophica bacterium]|nr:RluA family pseudouridine synthase [Candidatus Omnitrophota bacterium]
MQNFNLKATKDDSKERLDKFLVDALGRKYSRTFVQKLIEGKNILVNNEPTSAHHRLSSGEEVRVKIPDPVKLKLEAEEMSLRVVYEDRDVIVINKPAGLSVHPSGKNLRHTLVNGLLAHCRDLSGIGGVLRPGIVHRLDKDTTGLLVVAKNDAAHINLSNQFKKRKVKRIYIALARGVVQLDNGIVDLPLKRHVRDVTKMAVSFVGDDKKKAVTLYKVIKRFKQFTELELSLQTGRTHQIRVHMAYIGHPLLGDRVYGAAKGMPRQALHAKTLGFFHPVMRKFLEFNSEIPDDMRELIERGII